MRLPWSKKSTPEDFWNWVVAHKNEIEKSISDKNPAIVNQIASELNRTGLNCVFEFGKSPNSNLFEFTVSADGIAENVPDVFRAVDLAPKIDGWRILRFRQRETGGSVVIGNQTLSAEAIRFRHRWDETRKVFHVAFFVEDITSDNNTLMAAFNVILDCTIGEYEFIKMIGHVEFHPLSKSESSDLPLNELARLIDDKKPISGFRDPNKP